MNQFTFTLKDNTERAFNTFFWFLFFCHLIAASVIVIKTGEPLQRTYAIATIGVFALSTAVPLSLKKYFKLYHYQLLLFAVMAIFWILQSAWFPAITVITIVGFAFFVRNAKSKAFFSAVNIVIERSLFKKKYQWSEVEHVILKDNLLSIDFKNNHLLQVEVKTENAILEEATFNAFCQQQILIPNT